MFLGRKKELMCPRPVVYREYTGQVHNAELAETAEL